MQVQGMRSREGAIINGWTASGLTSNSSSKMTEDMAQNLSVWHMKTNAGP